MSRLSIAFFILLLAVFSCSSRLTGEARFHIGIATLGLAQAEDTYRGAERMIQEYGKAENGGMIRHIVLPDEFTEQRTQVITQITQLAEDPKIRVIVVNDAVPGTIEAFRAIKAMRPDILCLAAEHHESSREMNSTADLAILADNFLRGYLIPHTAKQLGADTFVHISFPRHIAHELLARRFSIMQRACRDLGLKFVSVTAADPMSSGGIAAAQRDILQKTPQWLKKYGPKTAFFATNDAHTEPLLEQIAAHGGIFVEPDLPSPLMGYPKAFNVSIDESSSDWEGITKQVEKAVVAAGASGRMGTWTYSYGWSTTCALAELGKRVVEGKARIDNMQDLLSSYQKYTPNAKWNGATYTDMITGGRLKKLCWSIKTRTFWVKGT